MRVMIRRRGSHRSMSRFIRSHWIRSRWLCRDSAWCLALTRYGILAPRFAIPALFAAMAGRDRFYRLDAAGRRSGSFGGAGQRDGYPDGGPAHDGRCPRAASAGTSSNSTLSRPGGSTGRPWRRHRRTLAAVQEDRGGVPGAPWHLRVLPHLWRSGSRRHRTSSRHRRAVPPASE